MAVSSHGHYLLLIDFESCKYLTDYLSFALLKKLLYSEITTRVQLHTFLLLTRHGFPLLKCKKH